MNAEKLQRLQASVRIGGKGVPRRKHKAVHRAKETDDKKLMMSLRRLNMTQIPDCESANMFMEDGNVIHFDAPKVSGCFQANAYVVQGKSETKPMSEMLPEVLKDYAPQYSQALDAAQAKGAEGEEAKDAKPAEEIPEVEGGDFETAAEEKADVNQVD